MELFAHLLQKATCRHQEAAKSCWEVWGPHQRKWWGTCARPAVVNVVTCGSKFVRLVSGDFNKYLFDPTRFFVSNFVEVVDRSSFKKKKGDFFATYGVVPWNHHFFWGVFLELLPIFFFQNPNRSLHLPGPDQQNVVLNRPVLWVPQWHNIMGI